VGRVYGLCIDAQGGSASSRSVVTWYGEERWGLNMAGSDSAQHSLAWARRSGARYQEPPFYTIYNRNKICGLS